MNYNFIFREIGIKHKIDPSRRDDDDIASVEKRVSERNAKDGIKIYYPPVEDKGDGFVIGEKVEVKMDLVRV